MIWRLWSRITYLNKVIVKECSRRPLQAEPPPPTWRFKGRRKAFAETGESRISNLSESVLTKSNCRWHSHQSTKGWQPTGRGKVQTRVPTEETISEFLVLALTYWSISDIFSLPPGNRGEGVWESVFVLEEYFVWKVSYSHRGSYFIVKDPQGRGDAERRGLEILLWWTGKWFSVSSFS